jgi:ABC-type xylose transport system permease subunit
VLTSFWLVLVPVTFALLAFLAFARPRRLGMLQSSIPELRASFAGFAVVVVLGFALNDSGVALPAMMFGVLDATLVYLAARTRHGIAEPDPTAIELAHLVDRDAVAPAQAPRRSY